MGDEATEKPVITLRKVDNALLVLPVDAHLLTKLEKLLTYDERQIERGWMAKQSGKSLSFVTHRLFDVDKNRSILATAFGLWDVVRKTVIDAGYQVAFEDVTQYANDRLTYDWNNVANLQFRPGQREFLHAVTQNVYGRFDCSTAFGKSFMIGAIAKLFPRARIDVVSKSVEVIHGRIYRELLDTIGDVGIIYGSKKILNRRVMCISLASSSHAPADADILIGDECHELSTERAHGLLSRWERSRNYGLSASMDLRWDNNDMRAHALFGPVVFRVNYQDAVQAGNVVPITVKWLKIRMDYNPASGYSSEEKKKFGIWRNTYRNQKIAEAARQYADDIQVLICVATLEHAIQLKRMLPEYTLVYRPGTLTETRKQGYVAQGLLTPDEPINNRERHSQLTTAFERGELKKVIATSIWNVGVSFNSLQVLFRVDGCASNISSVQIPGRVSRLHDGKVMGVLHDCEDVFDDGFSRNSKIRMAMYDKLGFTQEKERPSVFEPPR